MPTTKPKDLRRQRDLARIHIAKKDLGLSNTAYRAVIAGIMDRLGIKGRPSSANLTAQGRSVLLATFREMGWKPRPAKGPSGHPWKGRYAGTGQAGEAGHLTQSQADYVARLEYELGWQSNPDRLIGFIERQTGARKAVSMLRNREASKVITGLRKLHAMPYQTA